MTPRVIVKKLIRRWSISSSARCCDRHALLKISWFTTMSQKNVSDNGSDWCSDTTRRRLVGLHILQSVLNVSLTFMDVTTCPTNLILYFITVTTNCHQYKKWSLTLIVLDTHLLRYVTPTPYLVVRTHFTPPSRS